VDLTSIRATAMMGPDDPPTLTYRELQRRRELIAERMNERPPRRSLRRR
jgi:hypothetical protein